MTGELPRTTSGTPSYSLASTLIHAKLDEMLGEWQAAYGLTALEVYDILEKAGRDWLGEAVRDQQRRFKNRDGVIGTPRGR